MGWDESAHGYAYLVRLYPGYLLFVPTCNSGPLLEYFCSYCFRVTHSKGNRSNTMGPGKMTSQLEFHRYSKEIAGNLANMITEYEFKNGSGKASRLWINEEMRQFQILICVLRMKSSLDLLVIIVFKW